MYRQRNITFQFKTRMTEQEEELLLSWLNSIPGSTVTFFLFNINSLSLSYLTMLKTKYHEPRILTFKYSMNNIAY